MKRKIFDISPPLSPALAVWPGDTPVSRRVASELSDGAAVTSSALLTTVHAGAHADAPSHCAPDAPSIDQVPLEPYLGPCQVMSVAVPAGHAVTPDDLATERLQAERLLVRTLSYPDPTRFCESFSGLSPQLIDWLAERSVMLVGIDTPSIDPRAAVQLPAHHACLRHGILTLEGLRLAAVSDGLYELIALPLRLVDFDGSPVRAVLRAG